MNLTLRDYEIAKCELSAKFGMPRNRAERGLGARLRVDGRDDPG